jgi:hypothetical protein
MSIGGGKLAQDLPQNCPIDDYIWLMIPILGSLGYVMLRRNILKQNVT